MKAVVLVGGEGTRLRPLTLSTPKQMLPIVGIPMIERVLAHLHGHGVDEAILSLGYLPDAFKKAYPDGHAAGVRLIYAVEPEPLDTAGAVRFAARYGDVDETFVVVNGDVLTDLDLGALIAFHRAHGAEGTIALHPVPDPSAFGVVPTDADGRVTAFVEKPPRDEAPTNEINAGTYVLEASVVDRISATGRVSIERETFPAMVESGVLFAKSDDGYWLDTGTPATFLAANHDLLSGRRDGPPAPGVTDRGDRVFLEGVSVISGAVVGPSVVFGGCDIAPGARVERSVLGAGCAIEAGATVVDSVLMEGSHVAADASIAGSILGPHATVGRRADVRPTSVLGTGAVVVSGTLVDGERVAGEQVSRMRTMVTGGAGFIGSTLVDRLLVEGHEVDVIDDFSTGSLSNLSDARGSAGRALTIHHLDITAPAVIELMVRRRPELVFHLAAQADVRVSVARPAFDAEVNIVGSLHILEGARLADTERVVFAASGGTLYGEPVPEDLPVREAHPHQPLSPYGVAKKAVLDYLVAYRALHALEFSALALANVYGPRQNPHGEAGVVAIFADHLLNGEPVTIFGDGAQTRDFVYVDDVVDAFVRAATRGGGLICNIGTAMETSVNDLYATMAAQAGVKPATVKAPLRPGELLRSSLDIDRASIQLGWRPWTHLAEGTQAVLEFMRQQRP